MRKTKTRGLQRLEVIEEGLTAQLLESKRDNQLMLATSRILSLLTGVVRRNTLSYVITGSDIVVRKQPLGRSVRRIPFQAISDVKSFKA